MVTWTFTANIQNARTSHGRPDSKRFAFNFPQPAAHAFYETLAFYELHGDKWEMLESLAKANPISKAISKAISGGLAVERTKKHIKAKATGAIEIVAKVHEWTDPDTAIVYAYEEDGEETGKLFASTFSLLEIRRSREVENC